MHAATISAFALALTIPSAAWAGGKSGGRSGALGSVTSGVSSRSSSSSSGSSSSSSSSSSTHTRDHRSSSNDSSDDYGSSSDYTYVGSGGNCWNCSISTRPRRHYRIQWLPMDYKLAAFMQSVDDSDGAFIIDTRITHKGFGAGFSTNSYFERNRLPGQMDETIRMDIWSLYASARLAKSGSTHVDLLGGLAGARSNQFDHLIGGAIGLELVHRLSPALALEGGARYVALQEDINATEYRAGVRASILFLGYRWVEFNVGSPLRGPEAGVALHF